MAEKIKVLIAGAAGKTARAVLAAVAKAEDMQLVAAVDLKKAGEDAGLVAGCGELGLSVQPDLAAALAAAKPDVMVDFTNPQAVLGNIRLGLAAGVPLVVGTTGIGPEERQQLDAESRAAGVPIFIAPNFALGAVLMMRFAQEAARYFPQVELIELHHDQKLDAPSGTAIKTLEMMAENREEHLQGAPGEFEKISGSRGGSYQGMHVHSVRLPGYVASQEVLFGGDGQVLSIRHDTFSRDSFAPGVLLAIRKVDKLSGLVLGLEALLD